ncbi:mitochondrial intermembrane space import and assembly protein 40-B-like [Hydractinia symbiolongicarpus]|uniref:mitochondrial intermembrane space import and assembly protein 40-B-like n=1 Tax=Hydractinia symbiolongicarpus TaxID=13093 RepID=UPI00254AD674|nr:mitochondrial intermembrane space import and assembly protein 40-B-like [Hydractinia symbiolongicarpus]
MSYCRNEGKDKLIFVTKDDHQQGSPQSNPLLPDNGDGTVGLIKENGEINWNCPCLQGMADGPCGESFKDAFSCFHYSEAEPKGADCLEQFKSMQECFVKYPEIYGSLDDDLDKKEKGDESEENNKTGEEHESTENQQSDIVSNEKNDNETNS